MRDPRHLNEFSAAESLSSFVDNFVQDYARGMKSVDPAEIAKAIDTIETAARNDKGIYAMGNGGSAAIADHLCCDFAKGTDTPGQPPLMSQSLCAITPLVSAVANDFGNEHIFSKQVTYFCRPGDVLIAISSSGNSANIIAGIETAKKNGVLTIGMSGFSGGKLAELADIPLYVPIHNYPVVEDCHQSLMHVITAVIVGRREGKLDL